MRLSEHMLRRPPRLQEQLLLLRVPLLAPLHLSHRLGIPLPVLAGDVLVHELHASWVQLLGAQEAGVAILLTSPEHVDGCQGDGVPADSCKK